MDDVRSRFDLKEAVMRFDGVDIRQVEPGTEIEHEGEKLTVTDTQAVTKGRAIYVTAKTYAAIKARSVPKEGVQ